MSVTPTTPLVVYPDSDGRRMSENDLQYRWIVTLRENIGHLLRDQPDVYVAADHLIYAQQGNPKRRAAPDVYVAFGRPKGDRGSYKVWQEGGVFPQVVVEVLSPGNRRKELRRKFHFYQKYGAEEYVVIDPDNHWLKVYHRTPAGRLKRVPTAPEYVSPRLGVRYVQLPRGLTVYLPSGERFLTMDELGQRVRAEQQRADAQARQAESAQQRLAVLEQTVTQLQRSVEASRQHADMADRNINRVIELAEAERREKERLAAKLRALGLDPDAP